MRCATSIATALSTRSVPSASNSAERLNSCLPNTFEGGETVFNTGKAARELCYSIAAFARCAGSGRGSRWRSRQPALFDQSRDMGQGISCECQAGSNPKLEKFRVSAADHDGRQVILPKVQ